MIGDVSQQSNTQHCLLLGRPRRGLQRTWYGITVARNVCVVVRTSTGRFTRSGTRSFTIHCLFGIRPCDLTYVDLVCSHKDSVDALTSSLIPKLGSAPHSTGTAAIINVTRIVRSSSSRCGLATGDNQTLSIQRGRSVCFACS